MAVLSTNNVSISNASGRLLYRELNLSLDYDKVAIVGRNGVGKSTLLACLCDEHEYSGTIHYQTQPMLLPQRIRDIEIERLFAEIPLHSVDIELQKIGLPSYAELQQQILFSPGELRKLHLVNSQLRQPDMLLMDEPSQDLDAQGMDYLIELVSRWQQGLMVVSHDRKLLKCFEHFFVVAESGCNYYPCDFAEFEQKALMQDKSLQLKYLSQLKDLIAKERNSAQTQARRVQKQNQGRWRQIGRNQSKVLLNHKKRAAQNSRGRLANMQQHRLQQVQQLVKAARRGLKVDLPLTAILPFDGFTHNGPLVELQNVQVAYDQQVVIERLDLTVTKERVGLLGANGSGKSSLLDVIVGEKQAASGEVKVERSKIGVVLQGGKNWRLDCSLLQYLDHANIEMEAEQIGELLASFNFPLALAGRALKLLSPGELMRAALIALMMQKPQIELLILDEPSNGLDFTAMTGLIEALKAWQGALIVTSHDSDLLTEIGIDKVVDLG